MTTLQDEHRDLIRTPTPPPTAEEAENFIRFHFLTVENQGQVDPGASNGER